MPRKPRAMVGTVAASQLCACRHSRLRHLGAGRGECAAVTWVQVSNPNPPRLELAPKRCDCPAFTEPKGI